MGWWEDFKAGDPERAAEITAQATAAGNVRNNGEPSVMPAGSMDVLYKHHPSYMRAKAHQDRVEAFNEGEQKTEFQLWKERMGYGSLSDDAKPQGSQTVFQLWDSSLRIGRDDPFMRPGDDFPVGPNDPTPAAKPPGSWDTNPDTGAFEDENFFDDDAVEVVEEAGIPSFSEIELAQARNLLEAELRMSGFDSAAIGRLLDDWIIPRLTGTYFHEETGVTMVAPEAAIDILPELYEQQVFKDRFPGYHPRMDAGYNAMNVQDYLTYEDKFHELMVQYGLDILIEDSETSSREYIGNLISGNISLTQLGARITQGVSAVLDAPPEVLDQYEDWYGAEGENALLATYLDPTRDLIDLADKAGTAIAGGYARRVLGEQIELDTAQEIADLDYTNNQLFSAYSALAQQTALFAERAGEEDFDISQEGVDYALNLDTDVVKRVQQRRERRAGDFGGGGGALMSTQGTGFGATNA
jgi:hypothetical protein